MKNLIALFLFTIITIIGFAQTEESIDNDKKPAKNIIKLSPFHFAANTFQMSYERRLKNNSSLQLSSGYTLKGNNSQYYSSTYNYYDYVSGGNIELSIRKYISQNDILAQTDKKSRFLPFVAAYLMSDYYYAKNSYYSYYYDYSSGSQINAGGISSGSLASIGAGVLLGIQLVAADILFVDMYFGGGIKNSFIIDGENTNFHSGIPGALAAPYVGVLGKAGFQVGVKF